ncbi:hypothetical protein ACOSQ4_004130 [Xanthoceras sorbifolium]
MKKSHHPLQDVLKEFTSRFTGTLRDWYQSLELNDDTVFALPYSDPDSDPDSSSELDYSDSTETSIFQL